MPEKKSPDVRAAIEKRRRPDTSRDADRMPTKNSSCPNCGLALAIKPSEAETRCSFAYEEWERLCKYLHLGSPLLCLVRAAGR